MYQKLELSNSLNESFQHLKPIEDSEVVKNIRQLTGVPAAPNIRVSRRDLKLDDNYRVHLDIGGEGVNEHVGIISGFASSINVNAMEYQSNLYGIPIPNLVMIQNWFTNPSYPFADGFADYITMQNAPLTPKNVDEIARCLRPGGKVELWIDSQFQEEIELLAKKLNSEPEYDIEDEFQGSTGSAKVRIISGIKPVPLMDVETQKSEEEESLALNRGKIQPYNIKFKQLNNPQSKLILNSFFSHNKVIPDKLKTLLPSNFFFRAFIDIQNHIDRLQHKIQSYWPYKVKKDENTKGLEISIHKSP